MAEIIIAMTMISHVTLQCFLPDFLDSAAVSAIRGHAALHPTSGVIVLDAGKVIEEGSHDQLVAKGGRYATLFGLQAAGYR